MLVEVSFTPDELPTGDAQVLFYRLTLTPGTSLPAPVKASWLCLGGLVATGVGIEVVQSGTYGLQRATSFRVQRKTGPGVEEVAARQDILLGPGDAAIYGDYAQRGTIRNTGTEPVVVIGMAVVTMAGSGSELPPLPEGVRVELLASSLATDWANLPDGPVAVSLWRLRLPERSSVGPYAGAGLEALAVEQGMISRRYLRLAATTTDVPPEVLYPWEQSIFLAPAPHIRRSFTAGDDDPAVLLALSIEPQAIWSATLAP